MPIVKFRSMNRYIKRKRECMAFNETDHTRMRADGPGWRVLEPSIHVEGFLAEEWVLCTATDVNDDTGEIRVDFPVDLSHARKYVLDASLYRNAERLFPIGHSGGTYDAPLCQHDLRQLIPFY